MSSGGYDAPHLPSSFSRYDSRRSSGTLPSVYDRAPTISTRRRTPSPGTSRRHIPYDSYVPSRAGPVHREEYPNVYRPNNYRPDYSAAFYSPSSDRYGPPRSAEPDAWDRPPSWQPSPKSASWQERKHLPPSPTESIPRDRVRARDDMLATRMFEPSDAWKQTHVDRPLRVDTSGPSQIDHHQEYSVRESHDISPDRSSRNDRSPVSYSGSDRYRPNPPKWDSHLPSRGDSYRPQYDSSRTAFYPRDHPSPSDNFRREPMAASFPRFSSHYEPSYSGRRFSNAESILGSDSPRIRARTPPPRQTVMHRSSSREAVSHNDILYDSDSSAPYRYTAPFDALKRPQSRSSSRSSIASTSHSVGAKEKTVSSLAVFSSSDTTTNGNVEKIPETDAPLSFPTIFSTVNGHGTTEALKSSVDSTILASSVISDKVRPSEIVPTSPKMEQPLQQPHPESIDVPVSVQENSISGATVTRPDNEVQMLVTSPGGAKIDIPVSQLEESSLATHEQRDEQKSRSMDTDTDTPSNSVHTSEMPSDHTASIIMEPASISLPILKVTNDAPQAPERNSVEKVISLPVDIPRLSDAKTTQEALRTIVMTRLLCDRQTREERINPVLMANLSISQTTETPSTTHNEAIDETFIRESSEKRMQSLDEVKPHLVEHFKQCQSMISEKIQRLKEEYLSLHDRWLAHCATLSEQSKVLASEAESIQPAGRTTRRTTANLGDAVRSDLEMEQIIASLGNDDATDPHHLSARNLAIVPDMISVTRGKVEYLFDDTNNKIENPSEYYAPHMGMDDWTKAEKDIYMDKFAAHPKQFGLIAEYLPNKTSGQCVDFYYLHKKKHIDFRKVITQLAPNKRRRRGTGKKRGNGLLADIAQHDAEVHRDSASPSLNGRSTRGRRLMPPPDARKPSSRMAALEGTPTSTPTPEPEARPRRRRNAATPASRTVSVSLEDGDEEANDADSRPTKRAKRGRRVKSAAVVSEEMGNTLLEVKFVENNEVSSRKKSQTFPIPWTVDDKSLFLSLLSQYGDDFKRIAASMPNKTTIQVSNYYKSNAVELDLEKVAARAPKRSPTPEIGHSWTELPFSGSDRLPSMVTGTTESPLISSLNHDRPHHRISLPTQPILTPSPPTLLNQQQDLKSRAPETILTQWTGGMSRDLPPPTVTRPGIAPPVKQDYLDMDSRSLAPNHNQHYPSASYGHPPQGRVSHSNHSNAPSTSALNRYIYPPYSSEAPPQRPYDTRPQASLHPSSLARSLADNSPGMNRRPILPPLHRGENPYPVIPPSAPPVWERPSSPPWYNNGI